METEFDRLLHPEKKRVIDDLEAQERELVHQGRVAAPPIKKPKGFLTAAAQEAQRLANMRACSSRGLTNQLRSVWGVHREGVER